MPQTAFRARVSTTPLARLPERADGLLDELLEVGDVLERGWRAGVPEGVRDRVERSGDLVLEDLLDGAAFLLEEVELAVGGAPRGGVAVDVDADVPHEARAPDGEPPAPVRADDALALAVVRVGDRVNWRRNTTMELQGSSIVTEVINATLLRFDNDVSAYGAELVAEFPDSANAGWSVRDSRFFDAYLQNFYSTSIQIRLSETV